MNLDWLWRWMRRTSDRHFPREQLLIVVMTPTGKPLYHMTSLEALALIKYQGAIHEEFRKGVVLNISCIEVKP